MNKLAREGNSDNNGAWGKNFDLLDGAEDGEQKDIGYVKISKIFERQDTFVFWTEPVGGLLYFENWLIVLNAKTEATSQLAYIENVWWIGKYLHVN